MKLPVPEPEDVEFVELELLLPVEGLVLLERELPEGTAPEIIGVTVLGPVDDELVGDD